MPSDVPRLGCRAGAGADAVPLREQVGRLDPAPQWVVDQVGEHFRDRELHDVPDDAND